METETGLMEKSNSHMHASNSSFEIIMHLFKKKKSLSNDRSLLQSFTA